MDTSGRLAGGDRLLPLGSAGSSPALILTSCSDLLPMSVATASHSVVPGSIVRLQGIVDGPDMFVLECDRSAAECVWFNRNTDLARARFPLWADAGVSISFGAEVLRNG